MNLAFKVVIQFSFFVGKTFNILNTEFSYLLRHFSLIWNYEKVAKKARTLWRQIQIKNKMKWNYEICHITYYENFFFLEKDDKIDQKSKHLNQFRSHKPTLSFKPSWGRRSSNRHFNSFNSSSMLNSVIIQNSPAMLDSVSICNYLPL